MVDKNKQYKLQCGYDYVMMDTVGDYVFGRYSRDGKNWHSIQHDLEGIFDDGEGNFNLVEINPYADWKIDDKVLVWNDPLYKKRRYFAGTVSDDGKPMVFDDGATSWSNVYSPDAWNFAEKVDD
jgi:hypothetical protein